MDKQPPLKIKPLIVFDLDGTLTPSKSAIEPDMAKLIARLLEKTKVAIMSGGGYDQFQRQFLAHLPITPDHFSNLFILPTSGTRFWVWKGDWTELYAEILSKDEKAKIMSALQAALKASGYQEPTKVYGPIIEDRGSQITFSAVGQQAPVDVKAAWDPKRTKREAIVEILKPKLPEFEVRIGGSTSIDITRRGVNKAYGIHRLQDHFHLKPEDIVFVGDALFYGGNDYPARSTGVDCVSVAGPEETKKVIEGWLE